MLSVQTHICFITFIFVTHMRHRPLRCTTHSHPVPIFLVYVFPSLGCLLTLVSRRHKLTVFFNMLPHHLPSVFRYTTCSYWSSQHEQQATCYRSPIPKSRSDYRSRRSRRQRRTHSWGISSISSKARRPQGHRPPLRARARPLARPREVAVLDAAATACAQSIPTIFDFDPLRKLDAVLLVQVHSFFALLYIFQVVLDDPECLPARARGHHRGI
ncbi:hypothetical protein EDB83DRAFT_1767381 [Lactarius deliciosus]|nr:hypothetical protein EDB83DRAFT_1767381 [Lactarius deliciosus]